MKVDQTHLKTHNQRCFRSKKIREYSECNGEKQEENEKTSFRIVYVINAKFSES